MWKPLIVVAAATLVLTGCASSPTVEVEKPAAAEETEASPKITAPPESEQGLGEEALLEEVRGFRAVPILDSATDEQVIAAAKDACEQLEAGTRLIDVDVIDGDDPAKEGTLLAKTAHAHLCPDAPLDMSTTP